MGDLHYITIPKRQWKVWKVLARFEGHETVSSWVRTIAERRARHARTTMRRYVAEAEKNPMPGDHDIIEQARIIYRRQSKRSPNSNNQRGVKGRRDKARAVEPARPVGDGGPFYSPGEGKSASRPLPLEPTEPTRQTRRSGQAPEPSPPTSTTPAPPASPPQIQAQDQGGEE